MKYLQLIIISLFFISIHVNAQDSVNEEISIEEAVSSEAMTSELIVNITGLDSDKGTLMIAIYDSEGTWLSQKKYSQTSEIVNGVASVVFENVPIGTYGISTYHDENDNLKLDTNLFGIPSEPYASSRGAKGRFGPPKWSDAKFDISDTSHAEEIKY